MDFRIPIVNQNERFLDINGDPLVNGKVEILDPVSNNFLTVWTYSDDEYVTAENPVILDVEGRSENTVFCDRLVYCRSYKFLGLDENRHPMYEFVRDWYAGQDRENESRDYVTGMESLRDLDPSVNSSVNVIGYFNAYDCPLRTYIWDPNCNQDVDNGYIVGSNVSDTGRWILLFDGEYLPSSYYGVYPDSEGNISALVGYPDKVGTSLKPTAPGIWFVPGNYSSTFTTLKKLQIDAKCQFAGIVDCNSVDVVGTPEHYVGDFYVTGGEVHSSWYKNVNVFLNCGASTLVIDPANYFVTSLITNTTSLANKTLRGGNRLPVTFSQAGCYRVEDSTLLEGTIFDPRYDRVLFNTDKYGDGNFTKVGSASWDPGSITTGHRVQYSPSTSPKVKNFDNPAVWAKIMVEMRERLPQSLWSTMTLDFEGANVTEGVSTGKFTEVRNLNINNLTCNPGAVSLNLYNVVVRTGLVVTANTLSIRKSEVRFDGLPEVLRLDVEDSKVESNVVFNDPNMAIFGVNSYFGVSFNAITDNESATSVLNFNRCTFSTNAQIYSKNLTMIDCVTNNANIKVFPYKDGSNVYHLTVRLEGNYFVNNTPIEFTKLDNLQTSENCYDCVRDWVIVNNYFGGNTEGLRCRYWQNRTGSYYDRVFIKEEFQVHSIVYSGNSGNCPWENPKAYPQVTYNKAYTTHTTAGGTTWYIYTGISDDRKRIMSTTIAAGGDWAQVYTTPARGVVCKTHPDSEHDLRWNRRIYLAHYAHLENDNNGDFFLMCPSMDEKLDTGDDEVLLFV
jgi:hypothetical protein